MSDEDGPLGRAADDTRRRLETMMRDGSLRPGQRLGAERDLAVQLGVSRSTLRQALGALEADGLVRRVPGRGGGTFVSQGKIDRDLSRIVGVPALLRDQGFTAGSRIVGISVVRPSAEAEQALRLEHGSLVVDVVRIRLADGVPISLEHAQLPADRVPGLPERELSGSLYELLEREYGLHPHEAVERIEVAPASSEVASILGIRTGDALLSVTRTTVDSDDVPFEFSHDLFVAERTRIVVRSPGARDSAGRSRLGGRVL
ncbi:MAG TPA: GntR family transcriptional regulator, partial [Candidatus Nanopelagicales bacterium]|nr:GntR family transcriptional regulator [Candidatus Nanopelagicales bacterium]